MKINQALEDSRHKRRDPVDAHMLSGSLVPQPSRACPILIVGVTVLKIAFFFCSIKTSLSYPASQLCHIVRRERVNLTPDGLSDGEICFDRGRQCLCSAESW